MGQPEGYMEAGRGVREKDRKGGWVEDKLAELYSNVQQLN